HWHPAGWIPAHVVARPRTTMGHDNGWRRCITLLPAGRQIEDGGHRYPIPRLVGDPAFRAGHSRLDRWPFTADVHQMFLVQQQTVDSWTAGAVGDKQHFRKIVGIA